MSLLYHPDKLGDRSEEEQAAGNAMFLKVSAAYAVLSDEGSRRKYDIWVRGGRKRRPEPGDDMGPMPDYYRDDSVRDVQDTPAAWFGLLLTLVISAGLPLMLSMQGKHSRKRRPPAVQSFACPAGKVEVPAPHMPRKVRREREQRDALARCTPATADIVAVTTTEDTGVHAQENSVAAARSITKVSGPWSPEEDAELAKAIARVPGGSVDRWAKIADIVGTRTDDDCMVRAAALKAKPQGGSKAAAVSGEASSDARSAYAAAAAGAREGGGGGGGKSGVTTSREDLAKLSVSEFAKLMKEKEREKQQRARDKEEQDRALEAASAASGRRGKAGVVRSEVKASGSRSKHAAVSAQVMSVSLVRRARQRVEDGREGLRAARGSGRRGC